MHEAAKRGHIKILTLLLDSGANPDPKTSVRFLFTALYLKHYTPVTPVWAGCGAVVRVGFI